MKYRIAKSAIVVLAAAAALAGTAFAQDRNDQQQHDQSASTHRTDQNSEPRDQREPSTEQQDAHRDASRNSNERDSEHTDRTPAVDDKEVARYRHDHPQAAARCHDGFFTRTTDRNLACSKHGGIDTWLRE